MDNLHLFQYKCHFNELSDYVRILRDEEGVMVGAICYLYNYDSLVTVRSAAEMLRNSHFFEIKIDVQECYRKAKKPRKSTKKTFESKSGKKIV